MDQQDSCELLLRIEKEIDVNEMLYEGVHLWPLVRQCIWLYYSQGNHPVTQIIPKGYRDVGSRLPLESEKNIIRIIKQRVIRPFSRALKIARQSNSFDEVSAEICFLSQSIYYTEKLNGKPYNRIVDPLFESFSPFFRCLKLEALQKGENLTRKYPCKYVDVLPLKVGVSAMVELTLNYYNNVLTEVASIAGIEVTELKCQVSLGLQQAIKSRDTYYLLLKKLKPKLFFLASYYFPQFMGINWAASMFNIPTVDLQHGQQGKFHEMYTHWTKIPEEGYALLPTWFWSWGKPSVENIMKWQEDRKKHRCVMGGYPWISRWKEGSFGKHRFERPKGEKIILLTTQAPIGGLEDFFPDMLVDAIQGSPEGWCWIIREHPNYKKGNVFIKEKLKNIDSKHYIMNDYNNVSLYALLSECDFHVTAISTVCYEAEAFSVPTAIFSEIGRVMYEQEINMSNFIYCNDGESLIHAISNFKAEKNKVKYIESGDSILSSAFQTIAKGSGLLSLT